jgi:ribosomal protein S18 acetylase RimI-like enzyme
VIFVREGATADIPAVENVRRASWRAAYAGLIEARHIERATARPSRLSQPDPSRRTLVAVTREPPVVVGYASYGPERSLLSVHAHPAHAGYASGDGGPPSGSASRTAPHTQAGLTGDTGEVYALYVAPDWWSTGTGRSLMAAALAALSQGGYRHAVLWVLSGNARARRFYERAGFTADGAENVLAGLGGVLEVRYAREL